MIRTFCDQATKDIYLGSNTKRARKICPVELHKKARMRLVMLDQARSLRDLDQPGLDLKKINEWFQIRINKQYRIRFRWADGQADCVEIGEFHEN